MAERRHPRIGKRGKEKARTSDDAAVVWVGVWSIDRSLADWVETFLNRPVAILLNRIVAQNALPVIIVVCSRTEKSN